ncbi:MAG: hypothetical protein ACOZCL_07460, partial [Bacillota bacterium]
MIKDYNIAQRFDDVSFKIINNYVKLLEKNKRSNINNYIFEVDAIVENRNNERAIIEIKYYRNFSVNLGLIVFCKHKMHNVASYFCIGHLPSILLYFFLKASANLLLSPGNDI